MTTTNMVGNINIQLTQLHFGEPTFGAKAAAEKGENEHFCFFSQMGHKKKHLRKYPISPYMMVLCEDKAIHGSLYTQQAFKSTP